MLWTVAFVAVVAIIGMAVTGPQTAQDAPVAAPERANSLPPPPPAVGAGCDPTDAGEYGCILS